MDFEDDTAALNGKTSLAFLQAVYCHDGLPLHVRMKAAIAALPYEHPKLAVTVAVDGDESWALRLSRAIERSHKVIALRAIEGAVAPTSNGQAANDHTTASVVSAASLRQPMAQLIRRR
jgi:hypothetical protein